MARVPREETRALATAWQGEACLERERREQARYGVKALVNFEWMDEGVLRKGQGVTRDISPKGMFIYSDAKPPVKGDLRLDVSFQDIVFMPRDLQMRARGLVIRVEPASGPGSFEGFAVLNRSYDLDETVSSTKH